MKHTEKSHLYFFFSTWCGPSMKFKPVLENVVNKFHNESLEVTCLDINECEEDILKKYRILGIPTTLFILGNGKEFERLVGYNKYEDVLNFIRRGLLR